MQKYVFFLMLFFVSSVFGRYPDSLYVKAADIYSSGSILANESAPSAVLAPFGDMPSVPGGYNIGFYLDSLEHYSGITLNHSINGEDWTVAAIDPASLKSGYGSLHIPQTPAGDEVSFYLSIIREDSMEFTLPESAPDDTLLSFRVTSAPPPERQGYVAFNQRYGNNYQLLTDQDPFRNHYHGISGFDLETMEPFGILYNVGNYAPQIEMSGQRLIALNRESNSVDILNLDSWCLEEMIPLPDTLTDTNVFYSHSVLDPDRLIYYLHDGVRLLKVELEGGGKATVMRTGSGWIFPPISMEFNVKRDILLIGSGRHVELLDGGTNDVLHSFSTRGVAVPHLLNDGRVLTLEIKSESAGFRKYTGRNWLIASWYDPRGKDYARMDSVVSPVFVIPEQREVQLFISGMGITFQDNEDCVIVNLRIRTNFAPRRKILVWKYSGNADSLICHDIHVQDNSFPIVGEFTNQDGSHAIAGSILNSSLSLLDLDPHGLISTHYSPFTGKISEEVKHGYENVSGLALPPDERSPDIDGSGTTDIEDVLEMLTAIRQGGSAAYEKRYDLNSDNKINIFDLLALLSRLGRE